MPYNKKAHCYPSNSRHNPRLVRPLYGAFGGISSQPFSSPKDPSSSSSSSNGPASSQAEEGEVELADFRKLGLSEEIMEAVEAFGLKEPSTIQKLAMPQALKGEDLAFSAATGSGKTLAYLLPIMQQLKWQEQAGKQRQANRPRAIILVPTRELVTQVKKMRIRCNCFTTLPPSCLVAHLLHDIDFYPFQQIQVLEVTKQLSHVVKLSSCGLHGGEDFGVQRRRLGGNVDIVVSSPGRLLQHYEKGHVFFSQVSGMHELMWMDNEWARGKGCPGAYCSLTDLDVMSAGDKCSH